MRPDDPRAQAKAQAIERLHRRGASFVRCRGKGPIERPGWQRRRISPEDAFAHLLSDDGRLGIVPLSLDCAVIDVDGQSTGDPQDARNHNQQLTMDIRAWMGDAGYIACLPSVSNVARQSGKYHIWYAADTAGTAPLGKKADGSPYRLSPSGMLWGGPHTGFDVRFDGYVLCDQYLRSLEYALRRRPGSVSWKLKDIIGRGLDYKRAGLPESEALFEPPPQPEQYY